MEEGTSEEWRQIGVTYPNGSWSFNLERYSVAGGEAPWTNDLTFFREGLDETEPAVNAQWVAKYLDRVRTIYLFRCSINAPDSNLRLVNDILDSFRNDEPHGLTYAELEGWGNEGGQHITWEFSDPVQGEWWMALRREGRWVYFQMDLGNLAHRLAFKAGEVPAGVEARECRD